jgi:hypothetical protein
MNLRENDTFCSDLCRQTGKKSVRNGEKSDEATLLMRQMSPKNIDLVKSYLLGDIEGTFAEEPHVSITILRV